MRDMITVVLYMIKLFFPVIRVSVGGIKGHEWIVKGEEDGKNYETKMVVTNDKNVVKTMRAMFTSMSDMSAGMVSGENPFEIEKGYVVIKADGMKLESFKSKSLSSSVYILPKVTNTREAFNERNKRSAQPRKSTKKRVTAKDTKACYNNPCCGDIAGESTVLIPSLYKNKGGTGYFLVDSATCNKNSLGQVTEVAIVEEQSTGRRVHMELILNDKSKGIVQKLIDGQTNYAGNDSSLVSQANKSVSSNKAMYVHSRNTNQERMDIYINANTTLCLARMYKSDWRRSFEGWAEKGWIFYGTLKKNAANWDSSKPIPAKKASSYTSRASNDDVEVNEPEEVVEDDSGISDNDVDKAVNLLKSFF